MRMISNFLISKIINAGYFYTYAMLIAIWQALFFATFPGRDAGRNYRLRNDSVPDIYLFAGLISTTIFQNASAADARRGRRRWGGYDGHRARVSPHYPGAHSRSLRAAR